ncbi:zinc [Lasallia pustulata]|uniref:Zinc n=1 Tax=Lasallia pustulata TaxID=136370 RepID=A0A1W5D2U3_9LECA|nr:zinc [Lasallia pustulata]
MPSLTQKRHFKTLQKFGMDWSPSVITQYESERTGMRVVVVDQKGPKILGFFALATEIHDDSGAPHTLEHLCFMGSKHYQYKGVLDKLATRAYSTTNAWTATDHTAYTLDSAGWESFAQILPVYLEHVIVPTLTDSGCYTEVHHVDGTGHDAGVVYSEMQGVQNTQSELMDLRSKRLLYPEGVGFRYETGGMMEQLRLLTADRIRQFHSDMYQPKNLCLILVGEVDHGDLLSKLDDFEGTIIQDIPPPDAPFKRPWTKSAQPPPLKNSSVETVEFPEEDESSGEIAISFLGPDCNDELQTAALSVLLTYMAGSSASILENTLVEKEQVASGVYYSTESRPDTVIQFVLSSVDTEKLPEVHNRFFEVVKQAASTGLDMDYMLDCIRRQRRVLKAAAEASATFFTDSIITDFLFGAKDGSNLTDLASLREYDTLETWSDAQWRQYLRKWISDAQHVTILGKPSAKLSKKLKAAEEARIAEQKERLGEEGLKEKAKKLAQAIAENEREIPREILERFKVPETSSIHFINTTTARSGLARKMGPLDNPIQKLVDKDDTDLPLFIHFEHIQSNFVHINLIVGTGSIPAKLMPLLPIYIENFFNTPILRDHETVAFEKVIVELERDTVGYGIESGSPFGNPEVLRIQFQVEIEKYSTAIRWLRTMLWDSIFDITRLKATTARILSDVPEEKRSGSSMAYAVETMIHTSQKSIGRARSTLVKALYLKRVKRLLEDQPQTVVSQLSEIRSALSQFSNFRVFVIADLTKLSNPVSAWKHLVDSLDPSQPLKPLDSRISRLSEAGRNPGGLAYVVPLATIDSSFALSVAKGPETFEDPRLPALMVAISYLDAVEGPLWTAIRGTGLAYGTSFYRQVESGQISFEVYRSPDAFKAFARSKKVVEEFVSGATEFDSLALEGAISSIVLGVANGQATMTSAAQGSFIRQVVRGLPSDWVDDILRRVRHVSVEEIRDVMRKIILPVFMAETANLVVTCAPIMEEQLMKGFKEQGFGPEVKPLAFFQDDYGLKAKDGEDDADDPDEGEDGDEEMAEDSKGETTEDTDDSDA